jgi:hypothetical protein
VPADLVVYFLQGAVSVWSGSGSIFIPDDANPGHITRG